MVLESSHRIRDVRRHCRQFCPKWSQVLHIFLLRATPPSHTRTRIHPGDLQIPEIVQTQLSVFFFWNAPPFSVSIISPIDLRISFIAGHTPSSAVVGSLSLLRKPLLCEWSFIPANTIVIGFISVCRCSPIAIDTLCIRSRSIAASIKTSGQNRDLEERQSRPSESSFHNISQHRLIETPVRVSPFFHLRWGARTCLNIFACCPIGTLVVKSLPGLSSQFPLL